VLARADTLGLVDRFSSVHRGAHLTTTGTVSPCGDTPRTPHTGVLGLALWKAVF